MAAAAATSRIVLGLCVVALVVASSALSQDQQTECGDAVLACVGRLVEANSAELVKVQDGEVVSFKSVDCCKTIVEQRGNKCGCQLRTTLLDDHLTFGTADFCVSADVCN